MKIATTIEVLSADFSSIGSNTCIVVTHVFRPFLQNYCIFFQKFRENIIFKTIHCWRNDVISKELSVQKNSIANFENVARYSVFIGMVCWMSFP